MEIRADLHIHSRFSRATSKKINIKNLEKYARMKGINLLGTGDFTHPKWLEELKGNLQQTDTGILKTDSEFKFLLSSEVSNIYPYKGETKKIHNVILAPNFNIVEQINEFLDKHGNLESDGRPVFEGLTCPELVENLMEISKEIFIIPAHIWTPWFSLFGSKSGFDSIKECFQDQTKHIHALETGLSSDPAMNWRLSQLDDYTLVSFSDAHSHWPWRLGRECCIFEMEKLTYSDLINIIKEEDKDKFKMTLEFFPEEGKYHFDGHRKCKVRMDPKESVKLNNKCPKCGKTMTIGVQHRVEELADRERGYKPKNKVPFKNILNLSNIISIVLSVDDFYSKTVWKEYNKLDGEFEDEIRILLKTKEEDLKKVTKDKIAEAIIKNRKEEIKVKPGYDGVYGEPVLNEVEKEGKNSIETYTSGQSTLDQF